MAEYPWWEPADFGTALAVALVATVCWGSWSNSAKAAGDRVNFAHFYCDFCIGILLGAVAFFVSLGGIQIGGPTVAVGQGVAFAIGAGAVFGVANLLLTTGIVLAGLSIAFPICIGTSLVLGTLLTYWVDRRGEPSLLFPGVFLAFLGVLANAKAYGMLEEAKKASRRAASSCASSDTLDTEAAGRQSGCASSTDNTSEEESTGPAKAAPNSAPNASASSNIALCGVGGLLMSCWAPLSAESMKGEEGLSPYFSFVCFVSSATVVGLLILTGQQHGFSVMPRVDAPTGAGDYIAMSGPLHLYGLFGGAVWSTGTISNLVSGHPLGFALSFAIGQTAPIVAVLWGLLWYNEFKGAPPRAMFWLALMFVLFIAAITLLCLGGT